jgi:hypothetical protein
VPNFQTSSPRSAALTLERVKSFHSKFYGASNAQLAVVGDFDDKEVQTLVAELLGSWKSPSPYKRVPTLYFEVAAANKSFETPDKANAALAAGMNLKLRDDHPDYPALLLGHYILGSGMNSRLFQRIRQKEGLSYGVGAGFQASPLDESGGFTAQAIFAPQNVAKVEAAFKDELEKLLREGFTEEELKTAKSGWLQQQNLNRSSDQGLAARLSSYLFTNRKLDWDDKLESRIGELSVEHLNAAMRRHIDPRRSRSSRPETSRRPAAGQLAGSGRERARGQGDQRIEDRLLRELFGVARSHARRPERRARKRQGEGDAAGVRKHAQRRAELPFQFGERGVAERRLPGLLDARVEAAKQPLIAPETAAPPELSVLTVNASPGVMPCNNSAPVALASGGSRPLLRSSWSPILPDASRRASLTAPRSSGAITSSRKRASYSSTVALP